MGTKTVITQEIVDKVLKLAAQGMNNKQIGLSLDIGVETLSRNKQLKQAVQDGKLKLSNFVTQTVLKTLELNPANQQLLVKRLCLFNNHVDIKKPTDAASALDNLAKATKAYANGEINDNQLRTIEAVSNSYVKGYEITELETRIEALENNNGST